MAEKKKEKKQKETKTTTTSSTPRQRWSNNAIMTCAAFFSIVFIAVALILKLALQTHAPAVADSFKAVGECLAYMIAIWLGFFWTRKKHIAWLICWIVATVVIIVVYFVGIGLAY